MVGRRLLLLLPIVERVRDRLLEVAGARLDRLERLARLVLDALQVRLSFLAHLGIAGAGVLLGLVLHVLGLIRGLVAHLIGLVLARIDFLLGLVLHVLGLIRGLVAQLLALVLGLLNALLYAARDLFRLVVNS